MSFLMNVGAMTRAKNLLASLLALLVWFGVMYGFWIGTGQ